MGGPGAYELVAVERMAEDHGIFAFGRCSSECGKSIAHNENKPDRNKDGDKDLRTGTLDRGTVAVTGSVPDGQAQRHRHRQRQ